MGRKEDCLPSGPTEIGRLRASWPENGIHVLANKIRKYFTDRVDLLRQIPLLALEVDGRTGWNDQLAMNYQLCLHPLHEEDGHFNIFVELRTGMLINIDSYHDDPLAIFTGTDIPTVSGIQFATDKQVLKLIQDGNPRIERLVKDLAKLASEPYWKGYNPQEQEALKAPHREKLEKMMKIDATPKMLPTYR